ncbi:hypothetical protein VPH35_129380 [Triticum aestivum]
MAQPSPSTLLPFPAPPLLHCSRRRAPPLLYCSRHGARTGRIGRQKRSPSVWPSWCPPASSPPMMTAGSRSSSRAEEGGEGPAVDRFDPGAPPSPSTARCDYLQSAVSASCTQHEMKDGFREGREQEEKRKKTPYHLHAPPISLSFSCRIGMGNW